MQLSVLEIYLSEAAPSGTEVAIVSAIDDDVGANTVFEYVLEGSPKMRAGEGSGKDVDVFSIESATGIVTLAVDGGIDYEINQTIEMQVSDR